MEMTKTPRGRWWRVRRHCADQACDVLDRQAVRSALEPRLSSLGGPRQGERRTCSGLEPEGDVVALAAAPTIAAALAVAQDTTAADAGDRAVVSSVDEEDLRLVSVSRERPPCRGRVGCREQDGPGWAEGWVSRWA